MSERPTTLSEARYEVIEGKGQVVTAETEGMYQVESQSGISCGWREMSIGKTFQNGERYMHVPLLPFPPRPTFTLTADLAAKDAEIAALKKSATDYKSAAIAEAHAGDEARIEADRLRTACEAAKGFVERLQLTGIDASRGLNDCFVLLRIWAGGYQSEDEGLKLAITGLKDIKDQLTAAMARGTE